MWCWKYWISFEFRPLWHWWELYPDGSFWRLCFYEIRKSGSVEKFSKGKILRKSTEIYDVHLILKIGYDLSWKQEMGNCSPEISRFNEDRIQIIYRLTFKVRLSWLFGRIKISNLSNIKIISKCRSTSRKSETKLTSEPSEGIRKSFLFWWIF